jgi:glycosyltransferase involved in cell wall biosynthesis
MRILLETSNSFSNAFRGINAYCKLEKHSVIYLNNYLGKILNVVSNFFVPKVYDFTISMMPDFYTSLGDRNILWVHDSLFFEEELVFGDNKERFKKFRKILHKRALKADFIITPSVYSRNKLMFFLGLEKIKFVVQPIQIMPSDYLEVKSDLLYLKEISQKYNLNDHFNILFIGSPHVRKNLKGVLDIFNDYIKINPNAKLIIVSYPRPDIVSTFNLFDDIRMNDKITVLSHLKQSEINALMYLSSVLLNLSFEEGFGLPNIEAQFCGLPVIALNQSCNPEILANGAYLVSQNSKQEIFNAFKSIIEKDTTYKKVIDNADINVRRYTDISRYKRVFDLCQY